MSDAVSCVNIPQKGLFWQCAKASFHYNSPQIQNIKSLELTLINMFLEGKYFCFVCE